MWWQNRAASTFREIDAGQDSPFATATEHPERGARAGLRKGLRQLAFFAPFAFFASLRETLVVKPLFVVLGCLRENVHRD